MQTQLADSWDEGWLASPAVADLDANGTNEVVAPRGEKLVVWSAAGAVLWSATVEGRIWASPVVADFIGDSKLEIAIASRDHVHLYDATGNELPGWPKIWVDELRTIAAGDIDEDGHLDVVVATTTVGGGDIVNAWRADGSQVAGFPPEATGTSGCQVDGKCYLAGAYDQNLALGDLDGTGGVDLVVPHDNAYASIHHGSGVAFDAAPGFPVIKTPGVRYLHDLAEAQQGYANDEATALQAHFTNTPPAIADVDGDGAYDVVMLASVQNAAQTDRELGVALWVEHPDASRLSGWETPKREPDYVGGLWDVDGVNIVATTNQVTVADLDPSRPGPEFVFVGFDGSVHAVDAAANDIWAYVFSTDPNVRSPGVIVSDLSGDGIPEIAFATYADADGKGTSLYVLDAGGHELWKKPLPRRGSMAVPTVADVDGDGQLEIVVSLKDAEDKVESIELWTVPGSHGNCLLWPTGRADLRRDGWVP